MSRTEPSRRREPLWGLAMTLFAATLIAGCSSVMSSLPEKMGGLPEGAPARPETPAEYPKVHDMPPKRTDTPLTDKERRRLEIELAAARDGKAPCYDALEPKPAAADPDAKSGAATACRHKSPEKTEATAR